VKFEKTFELIPTYFMNVLVVHKQDGVFVIVSTETLPISHVIIPRPVPHCKAKVFI